MEERWADDCKGTELCWLVKKLRLWAEEERDGGMQETAERPYRAAFKLTLLLVQSLLKVGAENCLHPVNIRADLCGHKGIMILLTKTSVVLYNTQEAVIYLAMKQFLIKAATDNYFNQQSICRLFSGLSNSSFTL